jgi:hypothetical protein
MQQRVSQLEEQLRTAQSENAQLQSQYDELLLRYRNQQQQSKQKPTAKVVKTTTIASQL